MPAYVKLLAALSQRRQRRIRQITSFTGTEVQMLTYADVSDQAFKPLELTLPGRGDNASYVKVIVNICQHLYFCTSKASNLTYAVLSQGDRQHPRQRADSRDALSRMERRRDLFGGCYADVC
jgi:hypothetical protein